MDMKLGLEDPNGEDGVIIGMQTSILFNENFE